jgi:hypothetical protein
MQPCVGTIFVHTSSPMESIYNSMMIWRRQEREPFDRSLKCSVLFPQVSEINGYYCDVMLTRVLQGAILVTFIGSFSLLKLPRYPQPQGQGPMLQISPMKLLQHCQLISIKHQFILLTYN